MKERVFDLGKIRQRFDRRNIPCLLCPVVAEQDRFVGIQGKVFDLRFIDRMHLITDIMKDLKIDLEILPGQGSMEDFDAKRPDPSRAGGRGVVR